MNLYRNGNKEVLSAAVRGVLETVDNLSSSFFKALCGESRLARLPRQYLDLAVTGFDVKSRAHRGLASQLRQSAG
jgi:hypothetical protein